MLHHPTHAEALDADLRCPPSAGVAVANDTVVDDLIQACEDFPAGLATVDAAGRYLGVNALFAACSGGTVATVAGRTVREVPPFGLRGCDDACARVFATGRPEICGDVDGPVTADGCRARWRVQCLPLRSAPGKPVRGVCLLASDVTEQTDLARRLRRAEHDLGAEVRFRALLGSMFQRLTGQPDESIDDQIARALEALQAFAAVDHCSILELSEDGRQLRATTHWPPRRAGWIPTDAGDAEFPWYLDAVRARQLLRITRTADLPPEAHRERLSAERAGVKSHLCVPLESGGTLLGGIALTCFHRQRDWPGELTEQLRVIAQVIASVMALNATEMKLRRSVRELTDARDQLQAQSERLAARSERLREEIKIIAPPRPEIIDHSDAMAAVMAKVQQVAPTDSTVLVLGETGTGKELIAQAIHERSNRRGKPMVKVNCAALPSALVESELFGNEKGAYTGAISRRIGRFELAHQSTILLDEIGDLPLELQGKLLRVLQEGEFERLGSASSIRVNARVIAATNRDLARAVRDGTFREDLYYRLNVFTIQLPPLREHPQNIPPLVWTFTRQCGEAMAKRISRIPPETMAALQRHPWPGNVRQLRNVIEHGVIISTPPVLTVEMPPVEIPSPATAVPAPAAPASSTASAGDGLADVERRHILDVLERTHWRVSGAGGAAAVLGLKPTTLESRMRKLGIHRKA